MTTYAEPRWPAMPLESWRDTCDTLHMLTQIVGKIRLALAPSEPEWANVSLQLTARGLTTMPMPFRGRTFAIDFDFLRHALEITVSDGAAHAMPLVARPVAEFYKELMAALRALDLDVPIWPVPVEIPKPIPFAEDNVHASYEPELVTRWWRVLAQIDAILKEHRAPFRGRHTQVQFFWGTFDLAYTRFSGRPATPPSDDLIMKNAMDREEICAGFWPGDERFPKPAFWCYAYPKPLGIESAAIGPASAGWDTTMSEFILTYEAARISGSPRSAILEFLASTYERGAAGANWPEDSRA